MRFSIDLLNTVLELFVLRYYFNTFLTKNPTKKNYSIYINIGLYITVATILFTSMHYLLKSVIYPIFPFSTVFIFTFLYQGKPLKKIVFSLLYYLFSMLSESLVAVIVATFNHVDFETLQTDTQYNLFCFIASKLILIFIFRVIGLYKVHNKNELELRAIFPILLIELSSIISIYYLVIIANKVQNIITSYQIFIVVVSIIFANIATFYLLERQIQLQITKENLSNLELQYKLQKEYYSELKNNMISTNKNTHDIKNFIMAISCYIDQNKNEKAKEKIEEFYGKIPASSLIHTGNQSVDAVLKTKIPNIQKIIPDNYLSIIIPEDLTIDEIDLCILIGNGVDNAIEACEKIPDVEDRQLEIKIFPINNQLSILIENTFNTDEKKNSIFSTTKANKFMHGYGIRNIENIVEKYNGNITFDIKDNKFALSILFNLSR